jgi:serine/threonine-protein kinase
MEDDSGITKTGMIFGTPAYCAPETVDGADQVDARADLYNVGGVAYWMLTARPPFERKSALETILAHLRDQPTNPAELTEVDIPDALVQVVMKCLAKDPGARYQDADELNAALFDIEFSKPWTDARARDWWELHAPDEELESREAVKMGGEGEAETDTPERRLFARSGAGKKN